MKVLILQTAGKHNGTDGWTPNHYMRECFAIKYAFEQNGWEVDIWGQGHKNFELKNIYQIVFFLEQYDYSKFPKNLKLKFPKAILVQWIIDLHYQGPEKYYQYSKECDIILHSTFSLMWEYNKIFQDKKHLYFPNGVDDRLFHGQGIDTTKKENIIFVGSDHESRKEYIEKLKVDVGLKSYFATGIDMLNKISETKIHFNKNIGCDVNYRTFETIGIGTCLITNYDKQLDALGFVDGKNCLLYNDYNEALYKIRDALVYAKWLNIGKYGYELSKTHSYTIRIENLLKEL